MKKILGLDLGTNSIGWALIEQNPLEKTGKILGMGSRIIPMSQDILGKFDSGVSISQTAERTGFRGIRKLRERHLLRRERLHRVLNILEFLPEHYARQIDFEEKLGQFKAELEPKIAYIKNDGAKKADFLFKESFEEMLADFAEHQPALLLNKEGKPALIPYDWTIYYLRQKALTKKISKEELAWLLLHFNQKRGYYQLRGEEEDEIPNKLVEFYSLKVVDVVATDDRKSKDEIWYNVHLENGWTYRRTSKIPLDWMGKTKEFIVTTSLNDDGSIKTDKEGKEVRSFRAPAENDWTLVKKKTEAEIDKSHKTVGQYIYDSLLKNPDQKIKGKLVRVVERNLYTKELKAILESQLQFHPELQNESLYNACLQELYTFNEAHKTSIAHKGIAHLFLNDIIFYQRPLKSKKSLITNCKFEVRKFVKDGKLETDPIKGIAKSHPLFQEFRLWQFLQNLKVVEKNETNDIDSSKPIHISEEQKVHLFDWANTKKEIKQDALIKELLKVKKADGYRWNYVEDKVYPGNETRSEILTRLKKADIPELFLSKEKEEALWHILYSVDDKNDIVKALKTFADKNKLGEDFVEQFRKFPRIEKEYGSYSAKALKKLLPLMRTGKYWNDAAITDSIPLYQKNIQQQIAVLNAKDENITEEYRDKGKDINRNFLEKLNRFADGNADAYQGIEHFLASYLVYGKHSEDSDVLQWKTPKDIEKFLKEFRQHSLRNPIVEQVITETLRVVKDIWDYYGQGAENFFDEIHLELGREMKNPAEKRKQMTNQISENENTNLRIKILLAQLFTAGVENVRPHSPMQQEILKIYEEGVLSAKDGDIPDEILKISKQATPTADELKRYKLWLQQGYHSPYTGKMIPLGKLFTRAYDIEHIIPQSRYFDDSLSNKVICETDINTDKGNMTAYEYMKKKGGALIPASSGNHLPLLSWADFESSVKRDFVKSRSKMKKLLMEEIPVGFIERQMNDSRYISKVVKNYLSNIVRQDNEAEAISKKVVPVTGAITSQMKHDWGLDHIWNELITPRFVRLNEITQTKNFGDINPTTNKFLPQIPLEFQKGFNKKRIDHRHHALDALVIACITKEHTNYLNSINSERNNLSLVARLRHREEMIIGGEKRLVAKAFIKPWESFTQDAKDALNEIVVSYKQNLRVINKTVNHYQKWEKEEDGTMAKKFVKQTQGDSWAIRKPMHKDTVSGIVKLQFRKQVSLSAALDSWEMITDKKLRNHLKELIAKGYDKKKLIKYFKDNDNKWNETDISKLEIFYWENENAATRVKIDDSFTSAMIKCITDSGIQKIMLKHLVKYNEDKNGKIVEHPELAFSPDGLDELNKNIKELNGGKHHHPIFKVRTFEPKGSKFNVGQTGNKKGKFVEAAKGTNLFFAIYQNANGKRNYDTIPLNIVIERQKQGLKSVEETNGVGDSLVMCLSPNDLVYVPTDEERTSVNTIDFSNLSKEQVNRIYKMVSFSGTQCFFIRQDIATVVVNKFEFSALNKTEKSMDGTMIKECCIKLNVDRLGNVKAAL